MKVLSDKFYTSKVKIYSSIIIIPFLLYFRSLYYDFSPMDEQWLIIKNQTFLRNLSSIFSAFNLSIEDLYYRPIFMCSLILDYQYGALNPFMFHLTNILFHVLCCVFVFKFLTLIKTPVKTAFLFTIFFSVHPVLLNAVAWIPGRNDSMLCLFTLISFTALLNYLNTKKVFFLIFHLIFYLLCLFTKENAILLPFIFILINFIFSKFNRATIVLIAVWLSLSVGWLIIRNNITTYSATPDQINYITILKNVGLNFLIFIGKSFFPVSQSISPTISNSYLSIFLGLASILLLVFIYLKIGVKDKKIAFFGLALFFILLVVPVWFSTLAANGLQYEHRIYAPLLGLIIFITQLNIDFNTRKFQNIILIILIIFSAKSFIRMPVYKDATSYLEEGIEDCPKNYFFLFQTGVNCNNAKDFKEAILYFNRAIELRSNEAKIFQQRGCAYMLLKNYKKAIEDFSTGLKLSNNYNQNILLPRCMSYLRSNQIALALQDLQTLQQCCKNAIPLKVEQEIIYKWKIYSLTKINDLIAESPNSGILYVNRAKLFMDYRMGKEALADLKKACELEPNNTQFKSYFNELNKSFPH